MDHQDDDGVTITNYPEDDDSYIHPKANHVDNFVSNLFSTIGSHGWIILGTLVILVYIWLQYIQPYIHQWIRDREERQYEAKLKKDPDTLIKQKEKEQQARLKFQQQYEEKAQLYKEKMKEKEALKKQQQQAAYLGDGVRLGNGSDDSSHKKSYKPEYNPLAGSASLPSYRPPRRTACSRGNCG